MKKLPPNGRRSKVVPDDILKLETAQARCPGGHALPHRTNQGRCTPVYCAGSSAGSNDRQPIHATKEQSVATPRIQSALKQAKQRVLEELDRQADEVIDRLLPGETTEMLAARAAAKAQKADELQKLGHQIGRFAAKTAIFQTPKDLRGADAEEFFKSEAEALLPEIITDLKFDLRMGDDTQRREARRDILDAVGKRKQENAPNMANVFVLVPDGGARVQKLPWSKNKTITVSPLPKALPQVAPSGPKGPQGDQD